MTEWMKPFLKIYAAVLFLLLIMPLLVLDMLRVAPLPTALVVIVTVFVAFSLLKQRFGQSQRTEKTKQGGAERTPVLPRMRHHR